MQPTTKTQTTSSNANSPYLGKNGANQFFKCNFGHICTDGVKDLCEENSSFWFLDVILSYQISPKVAAEPFQVWTLERIKGSKFNVTATDGNDNILATQKIPYSDFPHDIATIWNVDKTIMLPQEY